MNRHLLFTILLLWPAIMFLLAADLVYSQVFLCKDSSGATRYKDRPCTNGDGYSETAAVRQEANTGRYTQTIIELAETKRIPKKQAKKIKVQQQRRRDAQLTALYRKERERKRERKQIMQDHKVKQAQLERKQQKCDLVKHKMQVIRKRLLLEVTDRQKIKLNENLNYYKYLQKKHCHK